MFDKIRICLPVEIITQLHTLMSAEFTEADLYRHKPYFDLWRALNNTCWDRTTIDGRWLPIVNKEMGYRPYPKGFDEASHKVTQITISVAGLEALVTIAPILCVDGYSTLDWRDIIGDESRALPKNAQTCTQYLRVWMRLKHLHETLSSLWRNTEEYLIATRLR